jgi:hypothetical protein
MTTISTKDSIKSEIEAITKRLESLNNALTILEEFERNPNNESKTIHSEASNKKFKNNSSFIIEILNNSEVPLTASQIRKLYSIKTGRSEEFVQQFVDSTLYKFNKDKKEIEKVPNPNGGFFLYQIRKPE